MTAFSHTLYWVIFVYATRASGLGMRCWMSMSVSSKLLNASVCHRFPFQVVQHSGIRVYD